MFEPLHVTGSYGDIMAGRMMVREHTACVEDLIPAFEPFNLVQNGWSKTTDIIGKVGEDVKFGFVDDAIGVNRGPYVEDIGDCDFKIRLWNQVSVRHTSTTTEISTTVYWAMSWISGYHSNEFNSPVAFHRSNESRSNPTQCK